MIEWDIYTFVVLHADSNGIILFGRRLDFGIFNYFVM